MIPSNFTLPPLSWQKLCSPAWLCRLKQAVKNSFFPRFSYSQVSGSVDTWVATCHRWDFNQIQGKIHLRQFIPIKPGKFGVKAFTRNESSSGYVLNSKIYTGKENIEVQRDLWRKAVMSVMQPYLDKGFYAFMDNYYTSVALFEELEERKTLACGTVRSNRVDLPREICGLKERAVKDLKRGECLYRQKRNSTWCAPWRERKLVSV